MSPFAASMGVFIQTGFVFVWKSYCVGWDVGADDAREGEAVRLLSLKADPQSV